jgi:hypothetical protein
MAKYTLDTTLGELLADPRAKTILDQYVPGVTNSPMIAMVQGMSLRMLVAMPQATQLGFTPDKAQAVVDEINKQVNP